VAALADARNQLINLCYPLQELLADEADSEEGGVVASAIEADLEADVVEDLGAVVGVGASGTEAVLGEEVEVGFVVDETTATGEFGCWV